MIDLSKYDKKVNRKELEEQMKKASENSFDPIPAGDYEVKLEKLELNAFSMALRRTNACSRTSRSLAQRTMALCSIRPKSSSIILDLTLSSNPTCSSAKR